MPTIVRTTPAQAKRRRYRWVVCRTPQPTCGTRSAAGRPVRNQTPPGAMTLQINRLRRLELHAPLSVVVEPDGPDAWLARCPDVPRVFGFGDDSVDAVADLKEQLEDLYTELQTDDNYSQEMLATKAFLARLLVPGAASHAAV